MDYDALHRLLWVFEDPDQDSTLVTIILSNLCNLPQGKNLQYVAFAIRVGCTNDTFLFHAFHETGGLVVPDT